MDTRFSLRLVGLVVAALLLSGAALWAQQDQTDKITSVLDAVRAAIEQGDAEGVGEVLSDSGFVAVMPGEGGSQCLGKAGFVDWLKQALAEGGVAIALEEAKIETHWLVALVSAKLRLPADPTFDGLVFDAVLIREGGNWHVASLLITSKVDEPPKDAVEAFVERVARLPESLKRGDADLVGDAIHDEHFILAFVDPAYELRWANSKTALTQIVQSVVPMITVNESRLDVARTVLGSDAAIVDGTWFLDIPDLGQTNSTIRAYAAKVDGQWKVVMIAGGPKG
jgi:ketosteroid isomerase-like protein